MSATLRPHLSGTGSVFEEHVLTEDDSHFTLSSLLIAPRDLLSPSPHLNLTTIKICEKETSHLFLQIPCSFPQFSQAIPVNWPVCSGPGPTRLLIKAKFSTDLCGPSLGTSLPPPLINAALLCLLIFSGFVHFSVIHLSFLCSRLSC